MSGTLEQSKDSVCKCCQRWNFALYPLDGDALCLYCYDYVRGVVDPYYGANKGRPARA